MKEGRTRGDAQSSCKVSTWHTLTHTHTERLNSEVTVSLKAKAEQSLKTQRRSVCLCTRTFLYMRDLVCHCGVFSSYDYVTGIAPFSLAGYAHTKCTAD